VALSNHPAWRVTQALWIADDRRLAAAPVCAQVEYNLLDRAAEDKLVPACQQFGLLRRRAAAGDAIRARSP
jgi:1-deoxyxylulose-5-phosphate synthase